MRDFLELMEEGDKLEASLSESTRRTGQAFEEKLVKFIELVANKPGYSKNKREYLMKEAETTSDFPFLFGTVLDRTLYAKYKAADPDWKQYIATGTQKDFRPQQTIGVYGLQGGLQQVQLRGEYPMDKQLGDGRINIQLSKYGREFALAWESVINDDLGAFSDIASRFALAAVRTEWRFATGLFAAAAGGGNPALFGTALAHPIDGVLVNNKFSGASTALSPDSLGAAAAAMRRFTDAEGEPVIFDGFELVVPPALEYKMLQVLNPANIIMAGGDSTAGAKSQIRTSANVTANLNITGHVNPYLPIIDTSANSATTWYLFAKLSNSGYAAKVNYLAGHEAPELCMKNPDKVSLNGASMSPFEGDYSSDSIRWRIRHVLGGAAIDPRFASVNIGA